MSKNGIGYAAANGSGVKNYGEKGIVGHTDSGESLSVGFQRADVKQVLGSARKTNVGQRRGVGRRKKPRAEEGDASKDEDRL